MILAGKSAAVGAAVIAGLSLLATAIWLANLQFRDSTSKVYASEVAKTANEPSVPVQTTLGFGDRVRTVPEREALDEPTTSGKPEAIEPPTDEVDHFPPDPEEDARELREAREELFERHDQDYRDPQWAPRAEQALSRTVEQIPGTHRLVDMDCRMTSCVAKVIWPNYEAAAAEFSNILHESYEPNCGVSVIIERSQDKGESEQRVFFHCEESRTLE